MSQHAKKRKISKIDSILISIFSIIGIIALLSWSWLLLYNPFISDRAGLFIRGHLSRIFTASEYIDELESANSSNQQTSDNNQDQDVLGPEGSIDKKNQSEDTPESADEKPTIRLQIYEGPVYSASDDSCSYIVIALVTGKPSPAVKFSKDDSLGSLGSDKSKISLKRNLRTYTLTATASNSLGTVMDSITLNWGCNSSPQISEIKLSSDIIYVNKQYEITAVASDPDRDTITYKWSVGGGSLEDDSMQTVKWNTPSESGDYEIKIIVKDSSGANTAKTISVYVGDVEAPETTQATSPPPTATTEPPATAATTEPPAATTTTGPQQDNFNLSKKTDEGGYLEYGGKTYPGGNVYAGDSTNNKPCMGFISFDITGLSGKTVVSASLTFSGAAVHDNPLSYLDSLWINVVEWGAGPIVQGDFYLMGVAVQSFTDPSITCSTETLKSELQKAINAGKSRFQIRVHFSGPCTDNDSKQDGWEYAQANINLNATVR